MGGGGSKNKEIKAENIQPTQSAKKPSNAPNLETPVKTSNKAANQKGPEPSLFRDESQEILDDKRPSAIAKQTI
jgi:flagellar basal body L-ring protein FlgH